MGFAPIHEVADDGKVRIKQFYWKPWFGDPEALPEIGLRDTFTGPDSSTSRRSALTSTTRARRSNLLAMTRPERLWNSRSSRAGSDHEGIRVDCQRRPPQARPSVQRLPSSRGCHAAEGCDVCKAEARIIAVTNSDAGKTIKVKGFVTCGSEPIIEMVSSFLYRGRFDHYENTFEILEEPD
ncbi:hypothetical protein OH76DRAFT_1490853 [Lentinus brumalis]|uniref:Fatty acid synthase meander beta sheet domain-containing protein n=1 Tax=Lentinus brumalis TaxID=2498619 RepID=A0A371CHJ9_9APHY|nr:hypothetical protein OH76DRAFT_1490853 [Polyporus brumalis]